MKRVLRDGRVFVAVALAAVLMFGSFGCLPQSTWRGIADTSARTVAGTVLDLTVIDALQCAFTTNCPAE